MDFLSLRGRDSSSFFCRLLGTQKLGILTGQYGTTFSRRSQPIRTLDTCPIFGPKKKAIYAYRPGTAQVFEKKHTPAIGIVFHWPLKQILLVKLVVNDLIRWPGICQLKTYTAPIPTPITSHTPFKAPTFLDQAFIIKTPHVVIELTVSCMEVRSGLT